MGLYLSSPCRQQVSTLQASCASRSASSSHLFPWSQASAYGSSVETSLVEAMRGKSCATRDDLGSVVAGREEPEDDGSGSDSESDDDDDDDEMEMRVALQGGLTYEEAMNENITKIGNFLEGLRYQVQFRDRRMLQVLEREGGSLLRLADACLNKERRMQSGNHQQCGSRKLALLCSTAQALKARTF